MREGNKLSDARVIMLKPGNCFGINVRTGQRSLWIQLMKTTKHSAASDTKVQHAIEISQRFPRSFQNSIELAQRARSRAEKGRVVAAHHPHLQMARRNRKGRRMFKRVGELRVRHD